jgi:hypothetical protein
MQHVFLEERLDDGFGKSQEGVEDEALHADVRDIAESALSTVQAVRKAWTHCAIGVCMI